MVRERGEKSEHNEHRKLRSEYNSELITSGGKSIVLFYKFTGLCVGGGGGSTQGLAVSGKNGSVTIRNICLLIPGICTMHISTWFNPIRYQKTP